MRTGFAITVLAITSVVVGACASGAGSSGTPGPSGSPAGGLDALEGRAFLSTDVSGRALVPGSTIRLSFDDGQIAANAGCNSMSGPYRIEDGILRAGSLATTEMGCDQPLMDQDTWVAALLDGSTIALDGATLTLAQGDTTVTFLDRELADPDRQLLGTRWILDGLIDGDAVSSVPAGVTAALTFANGSVQVEAGCNQGGGQVQVDETGHTLTFGPIALTKMACAPGVMAVEEAVIAVLEATVAFEIEADGLTIRAGQLGLLLRAED